MTAMPHEPLTQAEVLLEGFLALGAPEGFRAELIELETADFVWSAGRAPGPAAPVRRVAWPYGRRVGRTAA